MWTRLGHLPDRRQKRVFIRRELESFHSHLRAFRQLCAWRQNNYAILDLSSYAHAYGLAWTCRKSKFVAWEIRVVWFWWSVRPSHNSRQLGDMLYVEIAPVALEVFDDQAAVALVGLVLAAQQAAAGKDGGVGFFLDAAVFLVKPTVKTGIGLVGIRLRQGALVRRSRGRRFCRRAGRRHGRATARGA